MNAVSTWVLPSRVTVGRWTGRPGAPFQCSAILSVHRGHLARCRFLDGAQGYR
ncbi:hypothetical protein ACIF9R_36810 [Streptomyces sp. NPDC086080]|uniref:hypothetical protein n=1 Tax=Streptomyces sp. NPDC086080 TaxID=3365748 RepID=UPI0037D53A3E